MRYLIILCVWLSACESCDLTEVKEMCDATPSTTYLLAIRNVDFDGVGDNQLSDPFNHMVEVCADHFAANTRAGHQYGAAVDEINRQLGSEMHFTTKRSGVTHKSNFALIPDDPTVSIFDYVDVNLPMPNKCSLPDDLTFAMRTCRHDQTAGQTNFFTILVKSTNYGHFSDPTSDDYPEQHGILHELAHAYGMKHTGSWASADQDYISTMQGNLHFLSALDVAYLRHHYPEAMADHRNYVASTLTRFGGAKGRWDRDNPTTFYFDADGDLMDCATNSAPFFSVAWFNTGNLDGEEEICGVNRLFLRERGVDGREIDLQTWRIATMPNLSQDQWRATVRVNIDDPESIDYDRDWELVFKVNAWGTLDELTDEDNEITLPVDLRESGCGV